MRFTGEKSAFGRHESFALRFGWLTKGAQALMSGDPVFEAEDATVRLGVGKNMVSSIRYWLQATRMIERSESGWTLTKIGELIFDDDGCDPYLEDEATIWLLHWLIASNSELATTWWWFFNRFHKPEFTGAELTTALQDFAKDKVKGHTSASTLKSDSEVLRRMYVRSAPRGQAQLEEALDSPLSVLGLVTELPDSHSFESRPGQRQGLPPMILGFAVLELLEALGDSQLPVSDLMYGPTGYPALGAVFRLSEGALLGKLERLVRAMPDVLALRETAGIHQLYRVGDCTPLQMLQAHYDDNQERAAA
jgi:hypothetical protein